MSSCLFEHERLTRILRTLRRESASTIFCLESFLIQYLTAPRRLEPLVARSQGQTQPGFEINAVPQQAPMSPLGNHKLLKRGQSRKLVCTVKSFVHIWLLMQVSQGFRSFYL